MAFFLLTAAHISFAQSYSITPNDSMEGYVPFNDLYHFIIQQNNLTSNDIILSWEKIYADIPEGWTAYLCDLGFCYGEFPDNGTMDTVPAGDYGLLSVSVNPVEINGTAIIQYAVWETGLPDIVDTLTWIISAENVTESEVQPHNDLKLYPNPANNEINIHSSQINIHYTITNCSGQIVGFGIMHTSDFKISTNSLPVGQYFINLYENNTVYSEHLIIIH